MAAKKPAPADLPPGVTAKDLEFPKDGKWLPYHKAKDLGLSDNRLLLYKTARFGWVVTTLLISKAKGSTPDRYYGRSLKDGAVCTVGKGPHVLAEALVWLTEANLERLMPLVEAYVKGLGDALTIRDRISTRRAAGNLRRAGYGYDRPWGM